MKITERQILELFIEKELELKELKAEVKKLDEFSDFWYKEYNELEAEVKKQNESSDYWYKKYIELERAKNGNSEEATED